MVVWSSMSIVTVVPASAAAAQINRAFSVAMLSPSAPSCWPIADSFTDTSAMSASPASDNRASSSR